jgi:hypothetical protein
MGTGSSSGAESGRGTTLTPHPLLVPRSKKQSSAKHLLSLRPPAHTPAFCWNQIRLQSWSFSHIPALPLPVASTDHVYVVSLILNAAQVRRANSNAVALKLISHPPDRLPDAWLVEFKSGTLTCRTGNWAGPARTGCVWIHLFIYIASSAGVGPGSSFAGMCANALRAFVACKMGETYQPIIYNNLTRIIGTSHKPIWNSVHISLTPSQNKKNFSQKVQRTL